MAIFGSMACNFSASKAGARGNSGLSFSGLYWARPTGIATITLTGTAGSSITIFWGDGNSEGHILTGTDDDIVHDFGAGYAGNAVLTITGQIYAITEFTHNDANTFKGDIKAFKSLVNLTHLESTSNALSGDVVNLPKSLTSYFIYGANTIFGNVANLPPGLTFFKFSGSSTIGGSISNLPPVLTYILASGHNIISGDVADLPTGVTYCYLAGKNTIDTYTGCTFNSSLTYMLILPTIGYGLSSQEIDNLLIDLAGVQTSGSVNVAGNNAAHTIVSDDAIEELTLDGVTVTVNE